MTNPSVGHRYLALSLLSGMAVAAVGLVVFSAGQSSHWRLVTALSQTSVGEGKLFRSSDRSPDPDQYQKAIADSALVLLQPPDSPLHPRIRSLFDLSTGSLSDAGDLMSRLLEDNPYDAEVLNDLGVVYLARGTENTSNYFRAAQLFERSHRLSLNAHAPIVNTAIVRRKLKLDESADGAEEVQSESELLNSLH